MSAASSMGKRRAAAAAARRRSRSLRESPPAALRATSLPKQGHPPSPRRKLTRHSPHARATNRSLGDLRATQPRRMQAMCWPCH